jgi:hypothetical protein
VKQKPKKKGGYRSTALIAANKELAVIQKA